MSSTPADEAKAQKLQAQYNEYQQTLADLQTQLSTIGTQLQEYVVVDKTLSGIAPEKRQGRRCFKMIGGVLVEKSVDEVIKMLDGDIKRLQSEKTKGEEMVRSTRAKLEQWIQGNKVKIVSQ